MYSHRTAISWMAALSFGAISLSSSPSSGQSGADSTVHIYRFNRWLSGAISLGAAAGGILTIPVRSKSAITDAELLALDRSKVPSFDTWSLHQNAALIPTFEDYSLVLQVGMAAAPLGLLFDPSIRKEWGDIMLMAVEVNAVVVSIYAISPLGPVFQSRYRPVVYYPDAPVSLHNGNNKNSFYSGHVASASAAAFFMAKVYSDYHPELGADKYWLYGAALIPSLAMGYFRLKALDHFPSDVLVGLSVGTLCGVLIPEIHRIGNRNLDVGIYTAPGSTGLTLHFMPQASAPEENSRSSTQYH